MSRTPLYRWLAQLLRVQITSGDLGPGDQLPTELDLCTTHGVSRHTARDAMRLLREEGLIERKRGAGTVVASAVRSGPFSQAWGGVADILHYARDARLVVRNIGQATGNDLSILQLPTDQAWQCVSGLRRRADDGLALAATRICIRADVLPPHSEIARWDGALTELIEAQSGVTAARIEQEIAAVALDRSQARLLDVPTGSPALRTVRRYCDAGGAVFQASLSLHPADRFTYTMVVER
jgi:GntR family transcriptional regulator